MSLLNSIAKFFVQIWKFLTKEAQDALPIVEKVINELKAINATGIPADILSLVTTPAIGTAIEAAITTSLAAISTGIATASGWAAETPQQALEGIVQYINKADAPTKAGLLTQLSSSLYSAVSGISTAHASTLTQLHYTGELQAAVAADTPQEEDATNAEETT